MAWLGVVVIFAVGFGCGFMAAFWIQHVVDQW